MYLDWTYLVLVLPAVLFALWANHMVKHTYAKYKTQHTALGLTGARAAREVLDANGLRNVPIEAISGTLSDHYDPRANVVRLSSEVYYGASTAAVGIACHEVGHAIQHAQQYTPIKIRTAIVPITNIGSKLAMPLVLAGLILGAAGSAFLYLAYLGVLCFALSTVFQLVTLPTEFNASRRALASIRSQNLLQGEELTGARKVLTAAAMTYVAALAVSLMELLRLVLIVASHRRDD